MSKILAITSKHGGSERVIITLNSLANVHKVSPDVVYVDYYASDPENKHPYIIERIETDMKYDDILDEILRRVP